MRPTAHVTNKINVTRLSIEHEARKTRAGKVNIGMLILWFNICTGGQDSQAASDQKPASHQNLKGKERASSIIEISSDSNSNQIQILVSDYELYCSHLLF